jgi:hypothetical protein
MTTSLRPRVSVLMNSRNAPRFLPDAIRSVLWQSETDLELIVCEASDDEEGARIVASFDDPRVILLRDEERLGWAHGVNVAFARGRGALVAFMAGDDIMHPRCVAQMADAIDASGAGTAVVPVRAIDERGVPTGRTIRVPEEVRSERTWVRQFERNHIIFAMTRRDCLPVPVIDESIRGVGGDWHLWLRLVEAATGFCYVDELLFDYRVHGGSLVACEANTRTDMGAVLARFGEEAIDACYTRAGCDARTIEEARVWRAIARGRIRAALDATRAIQTARPAEPVWGFESGTLQLLLGASGAARRELQQAAETLNAPEAWNNLGVAQYRCGDRQRARESFQRALDLLPLYRDARRNLETGIPMQVTERPLRPLDQIVR